MRSSISSSDPAAGGGTATFDAAADGPSRPFERPGFVRLTASDRPGVAQPVPERDVPAQPWARILAAAVLGAAVLLAGWEAYWRQWDATPGYRNSAGAWAEQRARINAGEGDATVLVGTSRVLFDVQLPVWEQVTGERHKQKAAKQGNEQDGFGHRLLP